MHSLFNHSGFKLVFAIGMLFTFASGYAQDETESEPSIKPLAPVINIDNSGKLAVHVMFEERELNRTGTIIGPALIAAPLHAVRDADTGEQVTVVHSEGQAFGRIVGEINGVDIAVVNVPSLKVPAEQKMALTLPEIGEPVTVLSRTSNGRATTIPGTLRGSSQGIGRVSLRRNTNAVYYGGAVFDACGYFLGTIAATSSQRDARRATSIGNSISFVTGQRLRATQGYEIPLASAACPTRAAVAAHQKEQEDALKKAEEDRIKAEEAIAQAEEEKKRQEEEQKRKDEEARLKKEAQTASQRAKAAEEARKKAEKEAAAKVADAEGTAKEADKAREEAEAKAEEEAAAKLEALKAAEEKKKLNYIIAASSAALLLLLALIATLIVRKQKRARLSAEHEASNQREYAENLKSHIPPNPYSDCLLYGDESLKLPGSQLPEAAGGVTIGRHPSHAQVVLDRTDVSRSHARFYVRNNEVYVEDLNSTNGTFLNTRRLEPGERYIVQTGDYLKVGDHSFEFRKLN